MYQDDDQRSNNKNIYWYILFILVEGIGTRVSTCILINSVLDFAILLHFKM